MIVPFYAVTRSIQLQFAADESSWPRHIRQLFVTDCAPISVYNFVIIATLAGKSTTVNVVYIVQNDANYKDMFNKMVQQTGWQAICMCIFVVKTRQYSLLNNF